MRSEVWLLVIAYLATLPIGCGRQAPSTKNERGAHASRDYPADYDGRTESTAGSVKDGDRSRPDATQPADAKSEKQESDVVSAVQLESLVAAAIAHWRVPGCAVVVVKDNKTVVMKGFGVRRHGGSKTVDSETLFPIASVTKTFNAALIAKLIDERKITWDTPISKVMDVRFHQSTLTANVTFRDLLSHRVGLDPSNRHWYRRDLTRAQIIDNLDLVHSKHSLRSDFLYCNVGILVAGEAAAHVAGKEWPEMLQEMILSPLEMRSTLPDVGDPTFLKNYAVGHRLASSGLVEMKFSPVSNCAPATSIWSNAADMSKWLRFHLARRKHGAETILSQDTISEMHAPQMVVRRDNRFWKMFPDKQFMASGLGWFVHDYRGRMIVQHPGNINGVRAQIAIVPEEDLGIAVLANRYGSFLPIALMYEIVDAYLGSGGPDSMTRNRVLRNQQEIFERDLDYTLLTKAGAKKLIENDLSGAILLLDEAVKMDPSKEAAFVNRGIARLKLREYDGALRDLKRAVRIETNCAMAWDAIGVIYGRRRDYRSAAANFAKAAKADPRSARFWSNLAQAKLQLADYSGAIQDASQALQLDQHLASAYSTRGISFFYVKESTKAKVDLEKAVKIDPRLRRSLDPYIGRLAKKAVNKSKTAKKKTSPRKKQ